MIRAWRPSKEEESFVQAWTGVEGLPEWTLEAAARFHESTYVGLDRAVSFYASLTEVLLQPQSKLSPVDSSTARLVERYLWAFFQTGKLSLDSIAREVNLVYWHLDEEKRFDHPIAKPRWTSFYTVRQKLLRYEPCRQDPVSQVLKLRTTGEVADPAYRALSHWANVSLIGPVRIGPIRPSEHSGPPPWPLRECRVLLPDDPREEPFTYTSGFEVNQTGKEILSWLDRFVDEVYAALVVSLEQLKGDNR